jgi:hypothetical protein
MVELKEIKKLTGKAVCLKAERRLAKTKRPFIFPPGEMG